jgi:hypothetical protein
MSIQSLIAAVVLALAVGFGGGFYTKTKFTDAQQVTELRKDAQQTATNVVESVKRSTALEGAVIADGAQIDHIKEVAAARVTKYQPKQESKNASPNSRNVDGLYGQQPNNHSEAAGESLAQVGCPAGGGLVLDVGTVRLLNAARQGAGLDSTVLGHGEKPASPGPGG